jgi:hypothetical protein
MAGTVAPNMVTDGLVLYLDAANTKSYPGSGTTWNNIASGINNGTLVNGPTFDSSNGGSIIFDGTNDYADCGIITSLPSGTQDRTLMGWVQDNSLSDYVGDLVAMFGYGNNVSPGNFFMVSIGGTTFNNRKFIIWTYTRNHISSFSITRNEWTHITVTVTQDSPNPRLTIYKNGISDSGSTQAINTINTQPFQIAEWTQSSAYAINFKGRVSQIQAYNRALSTTEILQNYNATKGRYQ